jgi:hypothetical protein
MWNSLPVPPGFPLSPFQEVYELIGRNLPFPPNRPVLGAAENAFYAWLAIFQRFSSCAAHSQAFTGSVQAYGDAPPQPHAFTQDQEVFGFFTTGLATIESLCFGLYGIGALVDPQNFPAMQPGYNPAGLQGVGTSSTLREYLSAFNGESITQRLAALLGSTEFDEWKSVRNVLAHRLLPGRTIYASTNPATPGSVEFHAGLAQPLRIDEQLTTTRLRWLAGTLETLLTAAASFTSGRLPL